MIAVIAVIAVIVPPLFDRAILCRDFLIAMIAVISFLVAVIAVIAASP